MAPAYHVIMSMYGFWLPNDPRGSWSKFVGNWELMRFGKATKTDARRSLASDPHDVRMRKSAKGLMRFPPVRLTGRQALSAARGFEQACNEGGYVVHACSILPEHVHVVIAGHERRVTRIAGHLKARATRRLRSDGLWSFPDRPVWAQGCWRVFLNTPDDVKRAIAYVKENPVKEGKPKQNWGFVHPYQPYDNT
jgi:REP element-mobilizing transposase RayT